MFQPEPCAPHAVGIDDWAMCRGHSYGTIVVDLEKHQVIDLLPSRSAETLSQWLAHHPQISLVSRDRSPEYRTAVTDMLPEAVQVVDRWHLVKNLREALERSLEDVYPKSEMRDDTVLSRGSEPALRTRFPRSGADEQLRSGRRQQRIQRYQIVQELKSHGMSIRRISRLLGLARGTVRSFYFADTYPETQRRKTQPSMLDPYLPYLERRVQDGCTNAKQLWREIVARGYPGAPGQVSKWMTWRRRQNIDGVNSGMSNSSGTGADLFLPSRRTLSRILFTNPFQLDAQETVLLKLVKQNRLIAVVHELVRTFRGMIATKQTADFDGWLAACHRSNVTAMKRFANSIQQGRTAVLAAISTDWSNELTAYCTSSLRSQSFPLLRTTARDWSGVWWPEQTPAAVLIAFPLDKSMMIPAPDCLPGDPIVNRYFIGCLPARFSQPYVATPKKQRSPGGESGRN